MDLRKVVITGVGLVTPIGVTRDETWESLLAGRSGMAPIESFPIEGFRTRFAAEIKGFDPLVSMSPKEARKSDRYCQMALVAADEAVKQADIGDFDPSRAGVIIGSGVGGMITFEAQHKRLLDMGPTRMSPMFIPMMIADMASGLVSIRFGFRGANYATVSACASSAHAIAAAFDQIRLGQADVMISGGAEASVCPSALGGFGSMKAISTRNDEPTRASRPFDKDRDGFVLGEGSGILVLEAADRAEERGATILAEVAGYGMTADAYHITQPDPEGIGAREAMAAALISAGIEAEEVGYINAHGTSTYYNDITETKAIKHVFGSHAGNLAISSSKSMIGHLLGAAGAVECAATVLALGANMLPPTINLESPDPECDLDYCPQKAVAKQVDCALSNSFGFGGHNVALCLKSWQ